LDQVEVIEGEPTIAGVHLFEESEAFFSLCKGMAQREND